MLIKRYPHHARDSYVFVMSCVCVCVCVIVLCVASLIAIYVIVNPRQRLRRKRMRDSLHFDAVAGVWIWTALDGTICRDKDHPDSLNGAWGEAPGLHGCSGGFGGGAGGGGGGGDGGC